MYTWASVLQGKVLILKLVAIDGLSTSAIVVGEVTSLAHELGDDTVESGSLVAETTLTGAESTEVLSSARHHIGTELGKEKKKMPSMKQALKTIKSYKVHGHGNIGEGNYRLNRRK